MQKANIAKIEMNPVNTTHLNDISIFPAIVNASNPNPKNETGISHDCFNKKRSRSVSFASDESDSSKEFDNENKNSHSVLQAEQEVVSSDTSTKLPKNL